MAEFQFIVNGELVTYDSWENIPEEFEHVIKFIPDVPPDPHTEDEHAEMESGCTSVAAGSPNVFCGP